MEIYLSFLKTYIFGGLFNYIYLAVLGILVSLNLLFFIVKGFRSWYYKSLKFICLMLFVLTFGEFLTVKSAFTSLESSFIFFFSVMIIECAVYYFFCPLKKAKRKALKTFSQSEIPSDYGLSVKRAVEHIKTAEDVPQVFSGYVDVGYVKSLILNLKTNDLSETDKCELEDFEVYLLNFVNRQPNSNERQELSKRLNCLIKTISKYA